MKTPFWRSAGQLVRMMAVVAPAWAAAYVLLVAADAVLGPGFAVASGAVVDRVSAGGRALAVALGSLVVIQTLTQVLGPLRGAVARSLGARVSDRIEATLAHALLDPPGVAHLEDSAVATEISHARDLGFDPTIIGDVVGQLGNMAAKLAGALAACAILARFRWWAPLVLLAGWAPTWPFMGRLEWATVQAKEGFAVHNRRSSYYRDLMVQPPGAKEVRLFGLTDFLVGHMTQSALVFLHEVWRVMRAKRGPLLFTLGCICVGHGIVVAALARAASTGELHAGAIVVDAQAILLAGSVGRGAINLWALRQAAHVVPRVNALRTKTYTAFPGARPADGLPLREVRFERVRFAYPGREAPVFESLDLTIPAGRSLALVGVNGAGKTTLVKLLTRLYDVSSGRVLVDGIDLRELDPDAWRRRVAVILQDFVKYDLSARENVDLRGGSTQDAAARAGAAQMVEALPNGWDTILSRAYRGGTDLSGGQWQRIGLARAFAAVDRGAGVLVLDEPTASLDVRAEAELFDRFLDLTHGLTTVLISHRFSSVRHADRICVIDAGRVVEEGSHQELLHRGGRYAHMFRLQADRFADDD